MHRLNSICISQNLEINAFETCKPVKFYYTFIFYSCIGLFFTQESVHDFVHMYTKYETKTMYTKKCRKIKRYRQKVNLRDSLRNTSKPIW